MGELHITINGVELRDYIQQKTILIESSGSDVAATCRFTVEEPLGSPQTLDVQEKDEILIWDGATRLFGGVVAHPTDRHDGPYRRFDVRGSDFTVRLEEEIVESAFYEANSNDDDIIDDLFTNWLPEIDASTHVDQLRTDMPQMEFEAVTLREALHHICRKTGGMFYVDFYKRLHYFSEDEGVNAAFSLSTEPDMAASFPYEKFSRKRDATKLINRVLVVGNGFSVWVEEAASIAYYGSEYKGVVRDQGLLTIGEAEEYGAWYVGRYGWRHGEPDLTTRQVSMAGLRAGMRILLVNSVFSINQYYSIRKLQVRVSGGYSPDPQYIIRMKLGYRDAPGRRDIEPTDPSPYVPPEPPPYEPPPGGWAQEVYVGTETKGVFHTEDFVTVPGEISGVPTWTAVNTGLSVATDDLLGLTADPFDPENRQYALMEDGIYRRVSAAAWAQQLTHAAARTLCLSATGGTFSPAGMSCNINREGLLAVIYNATGIPGPNPWGSALLVSTDDGGTWARRGWIDGPTSLGASTMSLQVGAYKGSSPYAAGTVWYCTGFAGAATRLYRSLDDGVTWTNISTGIGNWNLDCLVDPNDQSRVFVGRGGAGSPDQVEVSTDHGATLTQYDTNASELLGYSNPYHHLSIAMDPRTTVRVGTQKATGKGLNTTRDDGATWDEPLAQWSDEDLGVSLIQDSPDFLYLMRQSNSGQASDNYQTIWASLDEGRTMVPKSGANASTADTGGGDSIPYNHGGIRGIVEVWTSTGRFPEPGEPYVPGEPLPYPISTLPGSLSWPQISPLVGTGAETVAAGSHASQHENGGADEIDVGGLSGLLADDQNPVSHGAADHTDRTRRLWLSPDDFAAVSGSPTKAGVHGNRGLAWLLDDTADELLATQRVLPSDWTSGTISVKVYYTMAGANTSDSVVLRLNRGPYADGEDMTAGNSTTDETVGVPDAADTLDVHTHSGTITVAADDLLQIQIGRLGSDVADDATGDLQFLGLGLEYTADM